jgi:hypothetical protein
MSPSDFQYSDDYIKPNKRLNVKSSWQCGMAIGEGDGGFRAIETPSSPQKVFLCRLQ